VNVRTVNVQTMNVQTVKISSVLGRMNLAGTALLANARRRLSSAAA
jgi:hypothetical protein